MRFILLLGAILLCVATYALFRPAAGPGLLRRIANWFSQLEGIRWALGETDLNSGAADAARQFAERGDQLASEGRYQEAVEAYQQAIEMAPGEPAAYIGLAGVYETLGDADQVLAILEHAAMAAPEDVTVLAHLGRAHCLVEDYALCASTLEKVIQAAPEDKWAHYWLAGAYVNGSPRRIEKALEEYQRALALDPQFSAAYLGLGRLYGNLVGQEAQALEALKAALNTALAEGDNDMVAAARAELGTLYYAQDDYDACIQQWLQVLNENPDDAVAYRRLGLCYAMRDQGDDMREAVLSLERAMIREFPYMDAYYYYLGSYYLQEGEYASAIWALQQFLRFSKDPERNAEVQGQIDDILAKFGISPE